MLKEEWLWCTEILASSIYRYSRPRQFVTRIRPLRMDIAHRRLLMLTVLQTCEPLARLLLNAAPSTLELAQAVSSWESDVMLTLTEWSVRVIRPF